MKLIKVLSDEDGNLQPSIKIAIGLFISVLVSSVPLAFDFPMRSVACNAIFVICLAAAFHWSNISNEVSKYLLRTTVMFVSASILMLVASLILITVAPGVDRKFPAITAILAFPMEWLGYYPAGPDFPLPLGCLIWAASALILVILADRLRWAAENLRRRTA